VAGLPRDFRDPSETPPRDFRATPETRLFPRTLHTYTCEQVIAVLDRDILAQLVGGYRYHQEKCAEAVAGRGVVAPPALTSLEHCYAEGAWVYRVTAAAGAAVFEGPRWPEIARDCPRLPVTRRHGLRGPEPRPPDMRPLHAR
jgi:hypothetical protein